MAKEEPAGAQQAVERPLRPSSSYSARLGSEGLTSFLVSFGFQQAAGAVLGYELHLSVAGGASFASLRPSGQAESPL